VVAFAHEVPLRTGCVVAAKAVPAKSIGDFGKSSFSDLCSIIRHIELEELPIIRVVLKPLSRLPWRRPEPIE
jgi:hypothetical protein